MKLIIPPFPNLGITQEAFDRDVISNESDSVGKLDSDLVLIVKFKNGDKRVVKSRAVKHDGKSFITVFPNPIHIFLGASMENHDKAMKILNESFPGCGKKIKGTENCFILDFQINGTHQCYNDYIKYKSSSIIMLVTALEAFFNYVIPNDFKYSVRRKGKIKLLNKNDIESMKVSFYEKFTTVIPQCLEEKDFWSDKLQIQNAILNLYNVRKKIIHLKTNSESELEVYFGAIGEMIDLDMDSSISQVIKFMNTVSNGFIQFKE